MLSSNEITISGEEDHERGKSKNSTVPVSSCHKNEAQLAQYLLNLNNNLYYYYYYYLFSDIFGVAYGPLKGTSVLLHMTLVLGMFLWQ